MMRFSMERVDFSGGNPALGAGGREFKSLCPDQHLAEQEDSVRSVSRSDSPPRSPKIEARFWAKVARSGPDECWLWMASRDRWGYGSFKISGRTVVASRYAYLLSAGHWPVGYSVCHSCDNPACCNPAHLWIGKTSDNAHDMAVKGRWRGGDTKGSKNGSAKLTEGDVERILERIAKGETNTAIAPAYGVHHSTRPDDTLPVVRQQALSKGFGPST